MPTAKIHDEQLRQIPMVDGCDKFIRQIAMTNNHYKYTVYAKECQQFYF